MKIGSKLMFLWTASMALYISVGFATWQGMEMMNGVSGLTIRFFLSYCAIIIVAQVFAAFAAINQLFRDMTEKQQESNRALPR